MMETNKLRFSEHFTDSEFFEVVFDLHESYTSLKKVDEKSLLEEYARFKNSTIEEIEDYITYDSNSKRDFANFLGLEFARINGFDYIGIASIKFADEYLTLLEYL